jgi:hypothetical protein
MPTARWRGNCHAIACRILDLGLVRGVARYGHYYGPVAPASYFSPTAPFHRHGWVERPDRSVLDPTRWVFEDAPPYIHVGPREPDYDPGGQRLRTSHVGPVPGRLPGDDAIALDLPPEAAQHLSDMTGYGTAFSLAQLFWIANLPPHMLGTHARPVYVALRDAGRKALVPIDNWRMVVEDPSGPPPHLLRGPSGRGEH